MMTTWRIGDLASGDTAESLAVEGSGGVLGVAIDWHPAAIKSSEHTAAPFDTNVINLANEEKVLRNIPGVTW
jgi:hypothetical protein